MPRLPAAKPSRRPGGGGEAAAGRAGSWGPRFAAAARGRRVEGPRGPPRCLPPRPRRRGCGVRRRRRRALRPGSGSSSGGPGEVRVPGGGSGGGSNRGSGAPFPGALGSRSPPGSCFSERRCRCGNPSAARSGGEGGAAPATAAPAPLRGSAAAPRPSPPPALPRPGAPRRAGCAPAGPRASRPARASGCRWLRPALTPQSAVAPGRFPASYSEASFKADP